MLSAVDSKAEKIVEHHEVQFRTDFAELLARLEANVAGVQVSVRQIETYVGTPCGREVFLKLEAPGPGAALEITETMDIGPLDAMHADDLGQHMQLQSCLTICVHDVTALVLKDAIGRFFYSFYGGCGGTGSFGSCSMFRGGSEPTDGYL